MVALQVVSWNQETWVPRNVKKSSTLEETPVGPFGMLMLICRGDVSGSLAS